MEPSLSLDLRNYRIEKRTGTVKLSDAWVISGGKAGNGWARRIIAMVSASSAGVPDEPASRLPRTWPLRLTVKLSIATPCRPAARASLGYCL